MGSEELRVNSSMKLDSKSGGLRKGAAESWRGLFERALCSSVVVVLLSCASLGHVREKECHPGCVDDRTRLECDENGAPVTISCPKSEDACVASSCQEGKCALQPAVDAPCGPTGLARCNEGFACLGPDLKLTAIRQHTCALADDGKVWCWGATFAANLVMARRKRAATRCLFGTYRDVRSRSARVMPTHAR